MENALQNIQTIIEQPLPIQEEKKAFVYKLQCDDGYYYYGSTKNKINYRLNNHKQDCKKFPERKIYKHINEIGWDNVNIEIVKEIVFTSHSDLKKEENYFIKKAKHIKDEYCLNEKCSKLTPEEKKEFVKEYYESHKEDILEKRKEYREENRETINKKIAEYRKTNDKHRKYNREYSKKHRKELYEKNKDHELEMCKKYYETHKEEILKRGKEWKEENKEHLQEYSNEYYNSHKNNEDYKEKVKERSKKYYEENYDAVRAKNKEYYEKNREAIIKQQKEKNKYADCKQIQCECGGKYVDYHKKRHMESKKHLHFIETYKENKTHTV